MSGDRQTTTLRLSSPPHITDRDSVPAIMWSVVLALMPAAACAFFLFGRDALILLGTGAAAALCAEALTRLVLTGDFTAFDGSAVITGLLVALNLPPVAPWWMAMIGSFFAIIIAKQLFGGLGCNIFNPALAARAFIALSWPEYMTAAGGVAPGAIQAVSGFENTAVIIQKLADAFALINPFGILKNAAEFGADYSAAVQKIQEMAQSPGTQISFPLFTAGCMGEAPVLLLLAGAIFLMARKIVSWHIPFSCLGSFAFLSFGYYRLAGHPAPVMMTAVHLLSGGMILGAFFMATDTVTSPVTGRGMIIFGAGCGVLAFVIRIWGGYPDSMCYSILMMNACVPLIDRSVKPKVFGKPGKAGT